MTLNNIIEKRDSFYEEGRKLKDQSRLSPNHNHLSLLASEKINEAVKITDDILSIKFDNQEIILGLKIEREYFLYEKYDCEAHYYYEDHNISKAVNLLKDSHTHIQNALTLIENIPVDISGNYLNDIKLKYKRWQYFQNNSENKLNVYFARQELDNENFTSALDYYRRFISNEKDIFDLTKNLEPVYERIALGNYVGMLCNISQTMAQIILKDHTINNNQLPEKAAIELLNYGFEAYTLSKEAYYQNPESDQYKKLIEVTYKNVINFLYNNKNNWLNIFINFQDKLEFLKIMQSIDNDKYNDIKSQALGLNKKFRLWQTGGFFILLFVIIFTAIYTLIILNLNLIYFISVTLSVEIIFLIISATILRSIDQLSEKNFLDLVKFALLNQFKIIKKIKGNSENGT